MRTQLIDVKMEALVVHMLHGLGGWAKVDATTYGPGQTSGLLCIYAKQFSGSGRFESIGRVC